MLVNRIKGVEGKKNRGEVGRFELHVNDLIKPEDEGCKEVSMMKESFEHMLMALRFGSESAAKNDLKSFSSSIRMRICSEVIPDGPGADPLRTLLKLSLKKLR